MTDQAPTKVAVFTEIPTPYRLPVFKRLAQQPGITTEFAFCAMTQSDRQWDPTEFAALDKTVLKGWQRTVHGRNTHTYYFNPGVIGFLRRGGFDVVAIGGWAQPSMVLAILYCLASRTPYVLISESHGMKPRSWLKKFLRPLFPGILIRRAGAYLVTGSKSKAYVQSITGDEKRSFVFPNTIDVEHYAKESARLSKLKSHLVEELKLPGKYNFLFVGRLVHVKGVLDLIAAFEKASEHISDWGLTLIGDGPLKSQIKTSLQGKPYKDRIRAIPYVQPSELVRYYAAADVFVLPSHDEPWGVVVNEAMASGLPIVVTNEVGAAGDLLQHGKNGFGFTAGDVEALTHALLELAQDREKRTKMAEQSKEIISHWGYDRNLQGFQAAIAKARSAR